MVIIIMYEKHTKNVILITGAILNLHDFVMVQVMIAFIDT